MPLVPLRYLPLSASHHAPQILPLDACHSALSPPCLCSQSPWRPSWLLMEITALVSDGLTTCPNCSPHPSLKDCLQCDSDHTTPCCHPSCFLTGFKLRFYLLVLAHRPPCDLALDNFSFVLAVLWLTTFIHSINLYQVPGTVLSSCWECNSEQKQNLRASF